ncbi:Uncharacterised protein [Salmonella bongori]|nr:Uncharacterised protein [Salmonella bongori]
MSPVTVNSLHRAHIRAWRVFTLMTSRRRGEAIFFYHPDTWNKARRRHRRAILLFLMRHYASDLAGTTPNTHRRIRHNKPVHLFSPCVKTSECQRAIPRRFDPTTETDKFCQMPDKTWRFQVVGRLYDNTPLPACR